MHPAGDWFCSAACSGIHTALREHVKAGVQPLVGEHSWQLMRVRACGPAGLHIRRQAATGFHATLMSPNI